MTHTPPVPASRNPVVLAIAALVVGAALGILLSRAGAARIESITGWVEPVGLLWVNAIRMTVIPLIVASLVVAVTDTGARAMGRLGSRSFLAMFALLVITALITTLVAPPLFTLLDIDAGAAASVRGTVAEGTPLPAMPGFTEWLVSLVPPNPIRSAVDGAMLPLVVATLAFSLALARVRPDRREAVTAIFRGIADAMGALVGWILLLAPLGVFSLAFVVSARLGTAIVGAVGFYIVAYSAILVIATAVVYAAVALAARAPLPLFARAVLPAQVVAVTTRSSMAALPAMVAGAEETLKLPPAATSFALPLAVSVFRLNQAVSWVVMALFAAKLYGVDLGMTAVMTLAVTSVLMSFSVPGIPSASLFVVAPFFASVGIPPEAIGVLIALDLIPDVFKTLLNVTGQLGVVTIVGSREQRQSREGSLP